MDAVEDVSEKQESDTDTYDYTGAGENASGDEQPRNEGDAKYEREDTWCMAHNRPGKEHGGCYDYSSDEYD